MALLNDMLVSDKYNDKAIFKRLHVFYAIWKVGGQQVCLDSYVCDHRVEKFRSVYGIHLVHKLSHGVVRKPNKLRA